MLFPSFYTSGSGSTALNESGSTSLLLGETFFHLFFLYFPSRDASKGALSQGCASYHLSIHAKWIIHIPVPIFTEYFHLFLSLSFSLAPSFSFASLYRSLSLSACYLLNLNNLWFCFVGWKLSTTSKTTTA